MTAMPAISRYVSIYRGLPAREQETLMVSLVLLPLFWLGLRLAGLQRFQAWLDRSPVARRVPLSQAEAAALGVAVNRAANHVLGPATCLTRSLLLRWLLRRYGTSSDLRIGVRFEARRVRSSRLGGKGWYPGQRSSRGGSALCCFRPARCARNVFMSGMTGPDPL